jgi:Na+/H+ antiporter NhaD/arsenite permease-like protein
MGLSFFPFVLVCAIPVALSLGFVYWFLARSIPSRKKLEPEPPECAPEELSDKDGAMKAILLTLVAIVLFLTPVPAYVTALGVAGFVLTSRKLHSRSLLSLVDWQLLAMFAGLFVVVRGLEISGWVREAEEALAGLGADVSRSAVYVPLVVVLGNLVGNVPAVMLLLPFVRQDPATGHMLALGSTFAGNAALMGSIANIIVAEQARRLGIRVGFMDHLRVGLPVTAVSLVTITVVWWFSG